MRNRKAPLLFFALTFLLAGCSGATRQPVKLSVQANPVPATDSADNIASFSDNAKYTLYMKAAESVEAGDLEDAIITFQSLGDYADAAFCSTYYEAERLSQVGGVENLTEALNLYKTIPLFRDSKDKVRVIEELFAADKEVMSPSSIAVGNHVFSLYDIVDPSLFAVYSGEGTEQGLVEGNPLYPDIIVADRYRLRGVSEGSVWIIFNPENQQSKCIRILQPQTASGDAIMIAGNISIGNSIEDIREQYPLYSPMGPDTDYYYFANDQNVEHLDNDDDGICISVDYDEDSGIINKIVISDNYFAYYGSVEDRPKK